VPGQKSGISVAHGSAHGVGIYTGMPGAAGLSRGFCDFSNMLICGAVDPDAKPIANVEKAPDAPQVHRNHSLEVRCPTSQSMPASLAM